MDNFVSQNEIYRNKYGIQQTAVGTLSQWCFTKDLIFFGMQHLEPLPNKLTLVR